MPPRMAHEVTPAVTVPRRFALPPTITQSEVFDVASLPRRAFTPPMTALRFAKVMMAPAPPTTADRAVVFAEAAVPMRVDVAPAMSVANMLVPSTEQLWYDARIAFAYADGTKPAPIPVAVMDDAGTFEFSVPLAMMHDAGLPVIEAPSPPRMTASSDPVTV